jgi:hypothetical protein
LVSSGRNEEILYDIRAGLVGGEDLC